MFTNKKLVTIIVIIGVVCALGLGAYVYFGHNNAKSDLPVVTENTEPTTTAVPKPVEIDAPTDGIDVSGIEDTETPAEVDARDKALEQEPAIQDDAALKAADDEAKRTEDAIKNPQPQNDPVKGQDEGVKVVVSKTEPTPAPEPKKDNGYIYTKEQAIKDGAAALQDAINTQSSDWTYAYGVMMENDMTDEQIQTLVQKAIKDPYSSTALADYYNTYRRDGDKSYLVANIAAWISNGGNDAGYNGSGV